MDEITILGLHIKEKNKDAFTIQDIFTKFGGIIKTRLGLNEVVDDYALPGGLILLELSGDKSECLQLENELLKIDGIDLQKMVFHQKSQV